MLSSSSVPGNGSGSVIGGNGVFLYVIKIMQIELLNCSGSPKILSEHNVYVNTTEESIHFVKSCSDFTAEKTSSFLIFLVSKYILSNISVSTTVIKLSKLLSI
jgi:hypothetical protein